MAAEPLRLSRCRGFQSVCGTTPRYRPCPAAGLLPAARYRRRHHARDHERMFAVIFASVSEAAVRPTGPAATSPSPPRVNWLDSSLAAPRSLITSITTSVSEPPICNPKGRPRLERPRAPTAFSATLTARDKALPILCADDKSTLLQSRHDDHTVRLLE